MMKPTYPDLGRSGNSHSLTDPFTIKLWLPFIVAFLIVSGVQLNNQLTAYRGLISSLPRPRFGQIAPLPTFPILSDLEIIWWKSFNNKRNGEKCTTSIQPGEENTRGKQVIWCVVPLFNASLGTLSEKVNIWFHWKCAQLPFGRINRIILVNFEDFTVSK